MPTKTYTAQEMRELAESKSIIKLHCKSGNLLPRCREWCPADDAKKCQDADDIRAALRYASEVMEENAQLKARLEAVVKMASESRISREVKNKGFRLYVEIDDFKMDLDMGDVVKSLNSIDAILRAAYGEGGAK